MAIIADLQNIKEERGFYKRIVRYKPDGSVLEWPTAAYQMRIAADSGGTYIVMNLTPQLKDFEDPKTKLVYRNGALDIIVQDSENVLKGGRKYYYSIVAIPEDGISRDVAEGTIPVQTSI